MNEFLVIILPLLAYYISMTLEFNLIITQVLIGSFYFALAFQTVNYGLIWRESLNRHVVFNNFESGTTYGKTTESLTLLFVEEDFDDNECDLDNINKMMTIIRECPNLKSLTIDGCPFLNNETIHILGSYPENFRGCESLSIKNCEELSEPFPSKLFPNLKSLCLDGCSRGFIKSINFKFLKELELLNCDPSDFTFSQIISLHPKLTKLSLGYTPSLYCLKKTLKECLNLKSLNISEMKFE